MDNKRTRPEKRQSSMEAKPKRERKPVRFRTDIVVTDAIKIKLRNSKRNKRSPSLKNKSKRVDQTNLGKGKNGDQTGQINISIVQKEATVALPVEDDTTVEAKPKRERKPVRFRTDIVVTDAMKIKHRNSKYNKRNPSLKKKSKRVDQTNLRKGKNGDQTGQINISIVQKEATVALPVEDDTTVENLMSTNNTDLMTSEIIPPPRTPLDSGFVVMKKNGLIENNSTISGVKNAYVTNSDKKRNKAKSVIDRISRAMENLPHSSLQYDTTITSQLITISHSRRLTGAELINDDYITYVSNNRMYTIKYLNRFSLDSEYITYQNIHFKESMKDPSGSCSSGYIKLNPGDRKRPSITTRYSFFYIIISGSAFIQLHNKPNMVYQGDVFFVPLGVEYSIRNTDKDLPVILCYVRVRGN